MVALGENKEWEGFSTGVTKEEYIALTDLVDKQVHYNGWFTAHNVRQSLLNLGLQLTKEGLTIWSANYSFSKSPKRVAIIMAGNIPLVGFHDFLCVLMSGNTAVCKLSSDDKLLLPALGEQLKQFVPGSENRMEFTLGRIGTVDAVIATGSNNSLKYFNEYFGKYPHIFRKNRTSLAVLDGTESKEELEKLGVDIFSYFGLGCRNVSHLLVPKGYNLNHFFEGIIGQSEVINNNKYANNYDYQKAVYLLNKHALLDNNFVLLRESSELFSPLGMIHYHYYEDAHDIEQYLEAHKKDLQVVVGKGYEAFGHAQCPGLNDYADGLDVMQWLNSLSALS